MEPQPLSKTANGGHIIESRTLQKLIFYFILMIDDMLIRRQNISFVTKLGFIKFTNVMARLKSPYNLCAIF